MPRYVALLRGISVGGHRSLRMETLRAMIEEAGGRDVATSIQSCNEVLTHPGAVGHEARDRARASDRAGGRVRARGLPGRADRARTFAPRGRAVAGEAARGRDRARRA
ncbi:MAG: DUF1697 domain-containing protein, partial [Deltaproteobacteria bacterium]|nr:DUF1697 domain-containing protein [Deltaproteobacteria bacterium]